MRACRSTLIIERVLIHALVNEGGDQGRLRDQHRPVEEGVPRAIDNTAEIATLLALEVVEDWISVPRTRGIEERGVIRRWGLLRPPIHHAGVQAGHRAGAAQASEAIIRAASHQAINLTSAYITTYGGLTEGDPPSVQEVVTTFAGDAAFSPLAPELAGTSMEERRSTPSVKHSHPHAHVMDKLRQVRRRGHESGLWAGWQCKRKGGSERHHRGPPAQYRTDALPFRER